MDTSAETGTGGRLAQGLRQMVDEAEHLLHNAADSGEPHLSAIRARFEAQLKHMRLQLEELEENAVHKARRAARATDQAVHAHPYSAMGLAAAVGVLVGVLAGVLVARR